MKSLNILLLIGACTLVAPAAFASVEVADGVEYLQGAAPQEACNWESSMVSAAAEKTRHAATVTGAQSANPNVKLSFQVVQLKMGPDKKKTELLLVARGNVSRDDKLIATRDLMFEKSFETVSQTACDFLRNVGVSLGVRFAEWSTQTRFIECGDDCSGIHPDEPIAVGAQILLGNAEAINDTVRDKCHWQTAMVDLLIKTHNKIDPPPRVPLEVHADGIETHPGRRLILRADNVHAVGGGGWTGPKWMDMSGELREGNRLIANFSSHTTSGLGLSTCGSLTSLSENTAEMIVNWLRNPTLDARLD